MNPYPNCSRKFPLLRASTSSLCHRRGMCCLTQNSIISKTTFRSSDSSWWMNGPWHHGSFGLAHFLSLKFGWPGSFETCPVKLSEVCSSSVSHMPDAVHKPLSHNCAVSSAGDMSAYFTEKHVRFHNVFHPRNKLSIPFGWEAQWLSMFNSAGKFLSIWL